MFREVCFALVRLCTLEWQLYKGCDGYEKFPTNNEYIYENSEILTLVSIPRVSHYYNPREYYVSLMRGRNVSLFQSSYNMGGTQHTSVCGELK